MLQINIKQILLRVIGYFALMAVGVQLQQGSKRDSIFYFVLFFVFHVLLSLSLLCWEKYKIEFQKMGLLTEAFIFFGALLVVLAELIQR